MKNAFASSPPTLWLRAEDAAGCVWSVYVGDANQVPQLEDRDAITLPDAHLIAVSSEIPFDRQCLALLHEMLHACVSSVGDPKVMSKILGCEEGELDALEECVVSFLAPRLLPILVRAGLLKFPKIPKPGR